MLKELSNSKILIPAMVILAILAAASGFYISLKQSQNQQQTDFGSSTNIEGLFWPNPKQIQNINKENLHCMKTFFINVLLDL